MDMLFDDGFSPFFVSPAAWDPMDVIGSSVITHWWNADDYHLMVDQGGGFISSWTDRIAGLAITATGGARPLYGATGFYSLPGLSFDGWRQAMSTTSMSTLPTGSTPGEIWAVVRQDAPNADTGTRHLIDYGQTGSPRDRTIFRDRISQTSALRVNDGSGGITLPVATHAFNGFSIVRARWTGGTDERVSALGSAETTGVVAALNTGAVRLCVGGSNAATPIQFWLGAVRHMIIVTGNTMTAAQADGFVRWLAWDSGKLDSLLTTNKTRP
jgi:hypothetical protein